MGRSNKKSERGAKSNRYVSSIALHFNESAMRLEELKKIANENQLKLLKIPKVFTIRWSEWTHTTISNILESWEGSDAAATGYGSFYPIWKI